jgi:hypothetical protein
MLRTRFAFDAPLMVVRGDVAICGRGAPVG